MIILRVAAIGLAISLGAGVTVARADEGGDGVPPGAPGIQLSQIQANGITMRVAEAGRGPLVLLLHGFPESWYSWRHQMRALAAAGYHVVAPDMRGYGRTDAPPEIEAYDALDLSGDVTGLLDALGEKTAVLVGHDWGAAVAWYSALLAPERFSALITMSVPWGPRSDTPPLVRLRQNFGDNFFYMLYHNEPGGVAEAEYDSDPRGFLSRIYLSPNSPREAPTVTDPKRSAGGWIPRLGAPMGLPEWLAEEDLDYYVSQFENAGFRGGVNYYRNLDRNWKLTEDLGQAQISVPTLFIAGTLDLVIGGADKAALEARMAPVIPDLRDVVLISEIGHWVQQEAPSETNAAMLKFLGELGD